MTDRQQQLEELKSIVDESIREAKKLGATGCDADISKSNGFSVTTRMGDVETIEHDRNQGLGVTVYFGQRKGNASSSDLNPASIRETVAAACAIARHATEDPFAGLPEPEFMATEIPDLDLCHPWPIELQQAIDTALNCEHAALEFDSTINNSEGATLSTHTGIQVVGNSHGFLEGYWTSRHSVSCCVIGEKQGSMQRDYWYTVAREQSGLDHAEAVGQEAARRTLRRLGSRSLTPRECPVLFVPEVARSLIGNFIGAISGGSLYRKNTFLLDSLGTSVFPDFMHIHQQPHQLKALGSAPFDAEGVATRTHDIVKGGIVENYVLGSYSARKLGLQTTGNAGGTYNLIVEPGQQDFQQLLNTMDTGLIVTELIGHGLNMMTGDYSRGAAGLWVENGRIVHPVEEITIAGNLKNIFNSIVTVGNDVHRDSNIQTGSVLVENMVIAGN
ncbi:MAG: metalloprotease PmbA [Gammaproteobacteria bacterium]|nr:metalloprotease PmbA [Gammaproteobacteria bacterium]